MKYIRIAFLRESGKTPKVLVQKLFNNKLMLPGGMYEKEDFHIFRTASRELLEETHIDQKTIEQITLSLCCSKRLVLKWENNVDTVFLLPWLPTYKKIQKRNKKDSEIIDMFWIPLPALVAGEYDQFLYDNIKKACVEIYTWLTIHCTVRGG